MNEGEIIIYNNVRKDQQNELSFLNWLIANMPNSILRKEKYILPNTLVNKTLILSDIIIGLQNSTLNKRKKEKCIRELSLLPNEIKVIKSINDISVDITIVSKSYIQFFEFHEAQHRVDANKRPSNVYTIKGEILKVPRYLQRLLRDIWRLKYLANYKIVWYDWFMQNDKNDFLSSNEKEFALNGNFKISELL